MYVNIRMERSISVVVTVSSATEPTVYLKQIF